MDKTSVWADMVSATSVEDSGEKLLLWEQLDTKKLAFQFALQQ